MSNPIPMSNPIALRNLMITMVILGIAVIIVVRTPDASQGVQAAVGWLLSVVTLWMRSGRAPALQELPEVPPVPRPPTVIVGPLLALVLLCSSCGALGASLGAAAIDCSAPTLAGQIGGLLVRVQEILRGGDPDWAAQLDQLAQGGREALACAVGRVASQPGRPAGVGPASAEDEAPRLAAQYLASRRLAVRP